MGDWFLLTTMLVLVACATVFASFLAVHTQQRLASFKERDFMVDALVWLNRQITRRHQASP
jgi:hypothetical protein